MEIGTSAMDMRTTAIDMDNPSVYRMVLVIGFALGLIGMMNIYRRASFTAQGTIVSSKSNCLNGQHARCSSTYVLAKVGSASETFIAVPAEYSLPKLLPVGTRVDKKKWHLTYSINGVEEGGYSAASSAALIAFGIFMMIYAALKNAALRTDGKSGYW